MALSEGSMGGGRASEQNWQYREKTIISTCRLQHWIKAIISVITIFKVIVIKCTHQKGRKHIMLNSSLVPRPSHVFQTLKTWEGYLIEMYT